MDPNQLQNTLNSINGQQLGRNAQTNQLVNPQHVSNQYNPHMLLQQQYLNSFSNFAYTNNQIIDFQQQQQHYLMQAQQHPQMFPQQSQSQQQLLQQSLLAQQVPAAPQMLPTPQQVSLSNQQLLQHQHQNVPQQHPQAIHSQQQRLYEEQCRQIEEQHKKQQEEAARIQRQREQEEKARLREEQLQREEHARKVREEQARQRELQEQMERERAEMLRQQQEAIRIAEEARRKEEAERIELEKLMKFRMEQEKKKRENVQANIEMQGRVSLVGQPLTLVATHFLSNYLNMLPFPYEKMSASKSAYVSDPSLQDELLHNCGEDVVATISNALSMVDVDDIHTRLDKLYPMEKETNDLFLDQMPPLIQAVVSFNTNALDVDSHNNMTLLENEDQIMQEDLVRPGPSRVLIQQANAAHSALAGQQEIVEHPITMDNSSPCATPFIQEGRDSIQIRRQMASVGKQPKAGGGGNQRKKKDMVESLFDSLTDYFDPSEGRRTRRNRPHNSEEDEEALIKRDIELINAMESGQALPASITGFPAEKTPNHVANDDDMASDSEARFFDKKGKKRKREIAVDRPPTPTDVINARDEEWNERQRQKNEMRKKRKGDDNDQEAWNTDALAENDSFLRFNSLLDQVFEQVEDIDLTQLAALSKKSGPDGEEDEDVNPELLIDRNILVELRHETQKLKQWQKLNKVNTERLIKLLTMLERNMRDNVSESSATDVLHEDENEEADVAFREVFMDRLIRASDAACTAVNIMTSHKMPKQVFLEDAIERAISLAKKYLHLIVFPSSDSMFKPVNGNKKKTAVEDTRRRRKTGANNRSAAVQTVYLRIVELFSNFSELVRVQTIPESEVHNLISMAVATFFVANVGELQVQAMRLLSNIFSRSDEHIRITVINDILTSLHRLPHGKSANTSYRLDNDQWISNTTALLMQLIQSVVKMPKLRRVEEGDDQSHKQLNPDAVVKDSFAQAQKITNGFLNGFLAKCSCKGNKLDGEEDYRRLFDSFLQDLLLALYRPEWPAAEMILTVLGTLLVKTFRSKADVTLRQACLDYLGSITARLRKDNKSAVEDSSERFDLVVRSLIFDEEDDVYISVDDVDISRLSTTDRLKKLEQALIDYLIEKKGEADVSVEYAVMFYAGEWYKETAEDLEIHRQQQKEILTRGDITDKERRKLEKKTERMNEKGVSMKDFLIRLVDKKHMRKRLELNHRKSGLLESDALWAVKFLAQNREFNHSFEQFLKHIVCGVGQETTVSLRTRALKCLTQIIEADYEVLGLEEVRSAVHARMIDTNAQVREAAIELLGKFVLVRESFIDQYYSIITSRILDAGTAVRKRVIRIIREICEKYPNYEKIPEMLAKIVKRSMDEEGVKKLVHETFNTLWLQPLPEKSQMQIVMKVMVMAAVAQHCIAEQTVEYLEQLLHALLKQGDKSVIQASKQIVDALVDNILQLETKMAAESSGMPSSTDAEGMKVVAEQKLNQDRLLACLTTLAIFSKVRPDLMVRHAETLQPYLSETNVKTTSEIAVMNEVIGMLERVVPLMSHPSDQFLMRIDEDLNKLVTTFGMQLVITSISCASAIWHRFRRIPTKFVETFKNYLGRLQQLKHRYEVNPGFVPDDRIVAFLQRFVFSLGVLARYFDFDAILSGETDRKSGDDAAAWDEESVKREFRESAFTLLEFFSRSKIAPVRQKALMSIGHFCAQYSEYLTRNEVKNMYITILRSTNDKETLNLRIEVLRNLEMFLMNEEKKMIRSNDDWEKSKEQQNLKEMELSGSGLGSTVIQLYWEAVLSCYFHANPNVRQAAVQVAWLTLSQGLVTPGSSIPTLIAMTTDPMPVIRNRIENLLKEIDSKYAGMVQSKSMNGIRLAYKLQAKIYDAAVATGDTNAQILRGIRFCDTLPSSNAGNVSSRKFFDVPRYSNDGQALLSGLYQILRTNRQQRRSFQQSILHFFTESNRDKLSLNECLFIADNLATFPYQMLDEPLYTIRQIDQIIPQSGLSIINQIKENLLPPSRSSYGEVQRQEDDDAIFVEVNVFSRFPDDISALNDVMLSSQPCYILMSLRTFLMKLYGFTDAKVLEYSPSEAAKVYEKSVSRKNVQLFSPVEVIRMLTLHKDMTDGVEKRMDLAKRICGFRKFLLELDRGDDEKDDEDADVGKKENDDADDGEEEGNEEDEEPNDVE